MVQSEALANESCGRRSGISADGLAQQQPESLPACHAATHAACGAVRRCPCSVQSSQAALKSATTSRAVSPLRHGRMALCPSMSRNGSRSREAWPAAALSVGSGHFLRAQKGSGAANDSTGCGGCYCPAQQPIFRVCIWNAPH